MGFPPEEIRHAPAKGFDDRWPLNQLAAQSKQREASDMGRVSGKIALVTGGASGIGRGCSSVLAREGATVVVTDVQEALGRDCVAMIEAAGGTAIFLPHDVTSEDVWIDVIAQVKDRFGRLDILVNNAGIGLAGP